MSLQVEKLEHNMAKLTIEVSADELEKALQNAYLKMKNKITIPGFRKGKAPRQMVEKMYGVEVFYDDAANELIGTSYEKELTESDLDVVSRPTIDLVQLEKGKPFIYTAEVALKPAVELGKYKGVKISKVDTEVTDADVAAEIEKERARNSRTITVTDRAVKEGDTISLDFEGFVDGKAFEGGKGENYSLTIGSNTFIPGFEDQLVGAEIGKTMDVNVTFPEDYNAKELAGKAAKFVCTVKEIQEKELPELNDEFASEVSEFETLEEYKADVKKNLTERKESEALREKEEAVISAIIDDSRMDIPEAMIDTEARTQANNYAQRLQQQGLSLEQYFKFTGLDMDKMLEQIKPGAEKSIKSRLVLEAVVDAEKIEISDDEYKAELAKMGEAYGMEADEIAERIGEEGKKQICLDAAIQKAIDLVRNAAVEA